MKIQKIYEMNLVNAVVFKLHPNKQRNFFLEHLLCDFHIVKGYRDDRTIFILKKIRNGLFKLDAGCNFILTSRPILEIYCTW